MAIGILLLRSVENWIEIVRRACCVGSRQRSVFRRNMSRARQLTFFFGYPKTRTGIDRDLEKYRLILPVMRLFVWPLTTHSRLFFYVVKLRTVLKRTRRSVHDFTFLLLISRRSSRDGGKCVWCDSRCEKVDDPRRRLCDFPRRS